MVRPSGPGRVPPSLVAEVDRRHRRDLPGPSGHRDLQQLERARELQRAPAGAGRVRQARSPAGRRLSARVPGDVSRRVADEADHDAVPEPDGDGRRGIDPLVSPRRRRSPHGLRQDEPREHPRRSERGHPDDRRHRRPDAQRPVARPRARLVQRLLALSRGATGRSDHRGRARRDRERALPLERPLHDHGDSVHDGLRHGSAGADAPRRRSDPGRRLAPVSSSRRPQAGRSSSWSSAT